MARRQGGIHFSYLIVAVVMCIGLIAFSFTQNGALEEANQRVTAAQEETSRKENSLRELSIKYDDLREVVVGRNIEAPNIPELTALRDKIGTDVAAVTNENPVTPPSIVEGYESMLSALGRLKASLDTQTASSRAKEDESLSHMRELDEIRAAKDEEIARLRNDNDRLTTDIESARSAARDEAARLQNEITELEEEWSGRVYQLNRDLQITKGLLDQADERIKVLTQEQNKEKQFATVDPDGKVLRVEEDLGFAYIDLGQQDRLRRGLIFNVFQYQKGGKRIQKGRVEVARIEGDWAEVRILQTYDAFNPIAAGDHIASPFYSIDDKPVFVFAGEKPLNNRLSREEIVQKIEAFGGIVEAAVGLETTYVVALQGYEETEEYEEARRFGTTILREKELLDFIEQ